MANSPNLITRSTSLASLLATVVSDGTYSDVLETVKVDATDQEAAASDIAEHGGQLIANLWDDATKRVVELYDRGTKVWLVADATERDALGSDDALAENDLAFLADTTGLSYCVSVDGGSASTWDAIAATGNVTGPGSSTDNAVARFDGTGGATLQNSLVIISDTGAITGVASIAVSGNVDGRDVSTDGATLDAHVASVANPHSVNLAQALAVNPDTAGSDLVVTTGDAIVGDDGGSIGFAAVTGLIELTDARVTGDLEITGKLTVAGLIDPTGLVLDEQATSPYSASGKGTVWTKNTSPTQLWFTDDAGNDSQVATGSSAGLPVVLAINATTGGNDIVVTSGDTIRGEDGAADIGGALALAAGNGDGTTNVGGLATLTGGVGAVSGAGGVAQLSGGLGGSTAGAGGQVFLVGGDAQAGDSDGGDVTISGGQASGEGAPGSVSISTSGAVSGDVAGGSIKIEPGDGAGSGAGGIFAAQAGGGGITGNGGYAALGGGAGGSSSGTGGSAFVLGGNGTAATASGGDVEISAGNGGSGAATGGGITITSGAGGATSGNSGNVTIQAGEVTSGTRGTITLNASEVIVTEHSYHTVRGCTARGSTNTRIYRWTGVAASAGTAITYSDSATAGGVWTITQDGIYSLSCSIDVGHNGYAAIKVGTVSNTFDSTAIVSAVEAVAGLTVVMAWTGFIAAGSSVWVSTSATTDPSGTPVNNNRMTVARVR